MKKLITTITILIIILVGCGCYSISIWGRKLDKDVIVMTDQHGKQYIVVRSFGPFYYITQIPMKATNKSDKDK